MKFIQITFLLVIFSFSPSLAQNYQELQKIQDQYKKALERQALQKPSEISEAEKTAKSIALPDKLIYSRKDIESLLVNTEKLLIELKFLKDSTSNMPYIGYDFFSKRDSIPFWQNLPMPKNYLLGPGDELIISTWGESNTYDTEIINRNGEIFISNIGILSLGGKTVFNAKKHIISKYSKFYSTLVGNYPKSFIDLTLGNLKSINIHFVGFVNIPGVHVVHPFSNIINGLIQAGGINNKGSLREIRVIRNNKAISSIDFYDYIFSGNIVNNLRLMDQDVIFVPPRKSTIPITGRVLRPGYYEILKNENLSTLINFAGGKDTRASESTFLYKNNLLDNNNYIIAQNQTQFYNISNGDSAHIPLLPSYEKFVVIDGQVRMPGKYPYKSNLKLKDLLIATSTLNDQDFYQTLNLSNIIIHRKNKLGPDPIKIIANIDENPLLENGDYISIAKKNNFQPIDAVKISGEIKIPGVYPVNNLTTLSDVIKISGGLTELALYDGIEIFRDSLKIAWQKDNFLLKKDDSLHVLKKSNLVLLIGEVNVPGYVSFKKGSSVKKYIKRAGGFSSYAERRDIFIVYPNGTAIPCVSWPYPEVREGSTIVVNQRLIGSPLSAPNVWQLLSIISNQAGNIATTLLTLSILSNQGSNGN